MSEDVGRSPLDELIDQGADFMQKNANGDTVLHSIVRFSKRIDKCFPQRLTEILGHQEQRESELSKKLENCSKMENYEHCTPLQLAFKLSAVPMVHWIIETYYQRRIFVDDTSHLKAYCVTELDTVTNRIVSATPKDGDDTKRDRKDWIYKRAWKPNMSSGLEMMFANNFSSDDALGMMDIKCVQSLIREKWKQERLIMWIFGIIYFIVLGLTTVYSVDRKEKSISNYSIAINGSIHNVDSRIFSPLSNGLFYFSFVISIVALLLGISLLSCRFFLKANPCSQTLHNIDYTVMFLVFAITLCLDCICVFVLDSYHGDFLLISLVFGWSFSTMFLRMNKHCGHLVDVLRQVMITHIFSFLCITLIINIAFGTCFFDLMRYVEDESGNVKDNENFRYFWRTVYTMFTVTIGLSEIGTIFESRNLWLAIVLFIIFMSLIYLLILNFLIAVMTETCTRIFSRRKEQINLHKLSSMLFIEDMFLLPMYLPPLQKLRVKRISKQTSNINSRKYHLSADSSHEEQMIERAHTTSDTPNADNQSDLYTPSFELCFKQDIPLPP